jgi:hypothetical protein
MAFNIQDLLFQWEGIGVFDFVLPFLLLFAIIYGILTTTNLFGKNKGVHLLIALAVGLLALRLGFVQAFFTEIFPRVGVGIAVILSLLIMAGFFIPQDERRFWMWGLGAIAFVITLIIVSQSFGVLGWSGFGYAWDSYAGWIIGAVLLIGVIIAIAASGGSKENKNVSPPLAFVAPWTQGGNGGK